MDPDRLIVTRFFTPGYCFLVCCNLDPLPWTPTKNQVIGVSKLGLSIDLGKFREIIFLIKAIYRDFHSCNAMEHGDLWEVIDAKAFNETVR
jgi:hypothetical protein